MPFRIWCSALALQELRLPFQFAMRSLVVHIQICYQALRENRPSQTLRNDKRIVAQGCKEFAQYFGLLRMSGDALHLGLQLVRSDRPLPVIFECLRLAR